VITLPDKVLTVRVPEEIVQKIEDIAEKLNKEFGKKFSTSDILRSAIDRDLKREEEIKENIFLKLPSYQGMTLKEAAVLLEATRHIQSVIKTDEVNEAVKKYEEHLEYAEFLEWKSKSKK
jgi:Arc/MetJ-type ribon-helix-helix transcriptional regulator